MDYERILKPQVSGGSGGFSPGKLRTMLMGVEKHRKQEEQQHESAFSLRSQPSDLDQSGCGGGGSSSFDNCKDVDVVSVLPECSNSTTSDPLNSEINSDRRSKDSHNTASVNSRARNQLQDPLSEYESFEFQQKGGGGGERRAPVAPFSKPAPSKWDDAQKWIASPTSHRPKAAAGQSRKVIRQSSTKVVVEVSDQGSIGIEEPDTKQMDVSQGKSDSWGQKLLPWEVDAYPTGDSYGKPVLMIENPVGESTITLSRHSSSVAVQSAMTFIPPPSTARSVSMRDMGTEMTPIASQEPSRTGTPVRATTPIRSPTSSRPSTPPRGAPESSPANLRIDNLDPNIGLSEKELQMKTRREIMALGTQLGKTNIAAWASKEEEDKDASTSFKNIAAERQAKSAMETRATAWEEAEKAKYMARFKREEMKIHAWENHQKAKTEAEMRKIEVEVERMRGRAHDKLMNKLAASRHKAEEKRAAAEAKRNQQAVKTEQQAEYIRRTGRIPSLFSCWNCCC